MISLSPFFISGVILFLPYYRAALYDLQSKTVPLSTWYLSLLAVPSSVFGWYLWWKTPYFDPRIFLLIASFIGIFFFGSLLWQRGVKAIGGGDIIAIALLMLFVPVLPEISYSLFYIFPVLLLCTFMIVGWNTTHPQAVPFIFPFLLSHATFIAVSSFI